MVAQSQSVSPLSWVIAASAEKCWSQLTSATASPQRSSSKCWKKSGITGGSNGLRAAGFIGSRSRRRYVSSRKREILCTTAVPVRSFFRASVTC